MADIGERISGEQKAVQAKYQAPLQRMLKSLKPLCEEIPDMVREMVTIPKSKTGFDETDLEPYNRAWNLLKYFQYATGAKNVWSTTFNH